MGAGDYERLPTDMPPSRASLAETLKARTGLSGSRLPPLRHVALATGLIVSLLTLIRLAASSLPTGLELDGIRRTWSDQGVLTPTAYEHVVEHPGKENATFVILVRNRELWDIVASIRGMEDRFNHKYHYPYVFLNEEPFTEEFKRKTSAIASGPCQYGLVPKEEWEEPDWVDQSKAATLRSDMAAKGVIYGGSQSYRRMCRYQSGFFWRHPLINQYRYYWRIEPSVKYSCNLDYDPFKLMRERGIRYGFTMTIYEFRETIATLWDTTKEFIKAFPEHISDRNLMKFLSNDGGETYNLCHYWSNFEIGDLDFWRGDAYRAYFDFLDAAGGFFYERWGDAPVHSIAASLFLKPEEVHFFDDIGYRHEPFEHCPKNAPEGQCACNPSDNPFEFHGYSCTPIWKKAAGWTG